MRWGSEKQLTRPPHSSSSVWYSILGFGSAVISSVHFWAESRTILWSWSPDRGARESVVLSMVRGLSASRISLDVLSRLADPSFLLHDVEAGVWPVEEAPILGCCFTSSLQLLETSTTFSGFSWSGSLQVPAAGCLQALVSVTLDTSPASHPDSSSGCAFPGDLRHRTWSAPTTGSPTRFRCCYGEEKS